MPNSILRIFTIALCAGFVGSAMTQDFASLPDSLKAQLNRGEVVLLPKRPDEKSNIDKRFVTMAKLMTGTRSEIWQVVIDKENADEFLEGVLESKVIEKNGNVMTMEQRTKVGGPKGSYLYTLKYQLTPESKAEFSFIKGDIKNVEGAWWIIDAPKPNQKLVVYSLHIDPGVFAPQFVVRKGIKKSIPETIISTEEEVIRRRG